MLCAPHRWPTRLLIGSLVLAATGCGGGGGGGGGTGSGGTQASGYPTPTIEIVGATGVTSNSHTQVMLSPGAASDTNPDGLAFSVIPSLANTTDAGTPFITSFTLTVTPTSGPNQTAGFSVQSP